MSKVSIGSLLLVSVLSTALITADVGPASAATTRPTGVNDRIFSAAGVSEQINCQGAGPVTLVVITGLGSPASSWSKVAAGFRAATRTCFYDRPGLGASPKRPKTKQVVDAGLYARELKALLGAAGEPGPYVVFGHSFGGLIARAFARANVSTVAGVLLAESVDPGDKATGPYWYEAGHPVNMHLSQAATGGGPKLGGRPLLVLSASHPEGDHLGGPTYGQSRTMINQWVAQQRADVRLSTNAIQVIAKSGHVLQQDAPDTVTAAVYLLVQVAAESGKLTCSNDWIALNATCR